MWESQNLWECKNMLIDMQMRQTDKSQWMTSQNQITQGDIDKSHKNNCTNQLNKWDDITDKIQILHGSWEFKKIQLIGMGNYG